MDKTLLNKLLLAQTQPLRILFYVYLPSLFFAELYMPWQSSNLIFNFLPIFVLVNVGYIAFIERDKLKQKGKNWFLLWISMIAIGIFSVEFIGIFTHTMISFYEGHPPADAQYWNIVATIFTGLGGVVLEINYFFSERIDRWIFSKVNPKYAVLGAAGFTMIIASLSLWMNPQTQNFLNSFL